MNIYQSHPADSQPRRRALRLPASDVSRTPQKAYETKLKFPRENI